MNELINLQNVEASVVKTVDNLTSTNHIKINHILPEGYISSGRMDIVLTKGERGIIINKTIPSKSISTSAVKEIKFDTVENGKRLIAFKTHNSEYLITIEKELN